MGLVGDFRSLVTVDVLKCVSSFCSSCSKDVKCLLQAHIYLETEGNLLLGLWWRLQAGGPHIACLPRTALTNPVIGYQSQSRLLTISQQDFRHCWARRDIPGTVTRWYQKCTCEIAFPHPQQPTMSVACKSFFSQTQRCYNWPLFKTHTVDQRKGAGVVPVQLFFWISKDRKLPNCVIKWDLEQFSKEHIYHHLLLMVVCWVEADRMGSTGPKIACHFFFK